MSWFILLSIVGEIRCRSRAESVSPARRTTCERAFVASTKAGRFVAASLGQERDFAGIDSAFCSTKGTRKGKAVKSEARDRNADVGNARFYGYVVAINSIA